MAKRKWLGPPREPRRMPIPGGTWLQKHPTRYGWDPDVRNMIDDMFRTFDGISINSYDDYPEGWSARLGYNTARRSLDVLDEAGRGVPITRDLGDAVVRFVFNYPGVPYIAWCIWQRIIWARADGGIWKPWQDDGTGPHIDHPYFTMEPQGWRP